MSLNHIVKATCPECKKDFPFEIWESVNVQLNPEMREKVLDGTIFDFCCPHCGHAGRTEYPFLYNDMKNGFMIWFCPGEENLENYEREFEKILASDSSVSALNNSYLRIVTNYFDLQEKIKIFESGYDDRLIELLKAYEVKELNHNKPENKIVLAVFDMLPHEHISPKKAIPTLVYINEDGEKVFDCPISIIPGAVGKIKEDYDYFKDKAFVINHAWASRYIYSEKISSGLFEVPFGKAAFSDKGGALAARLIILLEDEEIKNTILNHLDDKEKEILKNSAVGISGEKIFSALKAFYRYTNFKATLEELKDNPKFPHHRQLGFYFDKIDMRDFYTEYFKVSARLFAEVPFYYIQALIHGTVFDPDYPFDFSVESRDRTISSLSNYWHKQLTGEKENDIRVLKEYYKDKQKESWSLSVKNMCVRYMFQYDLPEDDVLRFDPPVTDKLWEEHKILEFNIYDYLHSSEVTDEQKSGYRKMLLNHILEIWKVAFTKYDIGRCFEEIAGYFYAKGFYKNDEYRKAYINQAISSVYRPNHFGMMYIKKQYKGEISANELKTYEIETGLPTHANEEIQEMIIARYKECKESENVYGQIYYLNLMYNFYDEKSKEALSIDSMLNERLRGIEL